MIFMALQYFLIIEQEGSFSAASRRLFVSQQSLSESMKKLEAEVGAELFVRRRPLQLTEAGRRFAAGARQMLAARDEMMRDIEALSVRQRDHLTLAVSTFQAPPFLPELLQSFLAEHPQIEVSVIKRQVRGIARHLDDVDLYFSFLPLDPELEHIPLIEQDKLVLVVRRGLLAQHCPMPPGGAGAAPVAQRRAQGAGDAALHPAARPQRRRDRADQPAAPAGGVRAAGGLPLGQRRAEPVHVRARAGRVHRAGGLPAPQAAQAAAGGRHAAAAHLDAGARLPCAELSQGPRAGRKGALLHPGRAQVPQSIKSVESSNHRENLWYFCFYVFYRQKQR